MMGALVLFGPALWEPASQAGPVLSHAGTLEAVHESAMAAVRVNITDSGAADVIVGVDGRAMTTASDLLAYLRPKNAGDRVTL